MTSEDDPGPVTLQDVLARAEAIVRQARAGSDAAPFDDRDVDLTAKRERARLARMSVYREIAEQELDAPAHEADLDRLLARAIALARGGELECALNVARVAAAIARVAKDRAHLNAAAKLESPLVQIVPVQDGEFAERATIIVSASAARASLSRLITHALQGDTIIIERNKQPIARLVPYHAEIAAAEAEG